MTKNSSPTLLFVYIHYNFSRYFIITVFSVIKLIFDQKDMKYRSKIDIMSQILEVANGGGVTKTKIMYRAFLSFVQLKEFLTILTESDLLSYDEKTQTFKTTEKGLRLLHTYNQLGETMKVEQ